MLSQLRKGMVTIFKPFVRNFRVAIIGGASDVGQSLSLMLRGHPTITELIIYDTLDQTPGVVMDLGHIPTRTRVKGYSGEDNLERALKNADVVLATGGTIMKPGITDDMYFNTNIEFIKTFAAKTAKLRSPMPFIGIATEPINSTVPMAAEVMRNNGEYDPKKLFGITCMDVFKAQCVYASEHNADPMQCYVPVIGGHSSKTLIPLTSQSEPMYFMSERQIQEFTTKVRKSEQIVMDAKKGWSPTLLVAYSAFEFTKAVLDGLLGKMIKTNAYVENNDFGTGFFSGPVIINKNGIVEMERYENLSPYECQLLEQGIEQLRKDVLEGKKILEFA